MNMMGWGWFLRAGPDRCQDDMKHQVKGTHCLELVWS